MGGWMEWMKRGGGVGGEGGRQMHNYAPFHLARRRRGGGRHGSCVPVRGMGGSVGWAEKEGSLASPKTATVGEHAGPPAFTLLRARAA